MINSSPDQPKDVRGSLLAHSLSNLFSRHLAARAKPTDPQSPSIPPSGEAKYNDQRNRDELGLPPDPRKSTIVSNPNKRF